MNADYQLATVWRSPGSAELGIRVRPVAPAPPGGRGERAGACPCPVFPCNVEDRGAVTHARQPGTFTSRTPRRP